MRFEPVLGFVKSYLSILAPCPSCSRERGSSRLPRRELYCRLRGNDEGGCGNVGQGCNVCGVAWGRRPSWWAACCDAAMPVALGGNKENGVRLPRASALLTKPLYFIWRQNACRSLGGGVRVTAWLCNLSRIVLKPPKANEIILLATKNNLTAFSRAFARIFFAAGGGAAFQADFLAAACGGGHARCGDGFWRADVAFGSDFFRHKRVFLSTLHTPKLLIHQPLRPLIACTASVEPNIRPQLGPVFQAHTQTGEKFTKVPTHLCGR